MDLHAWITDAVNARTSLAEKASQDLDSADLAAETLRRCDADRRILARHSVDPRRAADRWWATACEGCGYYSDDSGDPNVENINDCPELLDLAHALGLTAEQLANLDRPERPPYIPPPKRTDANMTADQAPATFRP